MHVTPAAPPDRAAGARTRQPENSKRAHLSVPALQTPPKFHEKDQQESEKRKKNCGGREKKARNFGPPPFGPPPFGKPFGHGRLWPNRLWPNRLRLVFVCVCVCLCVCLCVCVFVCVCVCVCVCWFHGFRVGVSRFWFGHVRCPRNRPSGDRPSPGPPKIPLFVPFPAAKFVLFLPSLGVFSWNFGGV